MEKVEKKKMSYQYEEVKLVHEVKLEVGSRYKARHIEVRGELDFSD